MKTSVGFSVFRLQSLAVALLLVQCSTVLADDFDRLCEGRAAIERVYYNHRLGEKAPFGQASPPTLIERIVREEQRKEAALRKIYGLEISSAQLDAEVRRINATTRAPEMLVEVKAALGGDPQKFARVFAKPFLVERLLRDRFENDDALHAPQRRIAETLRNRVLEVKESGFDPRFGVLKQCQDGDVHGQVTWEMTPRPATAAPASRASAAAPTETKASGGIYRIEATAQVAQVLSSPEEPRQDKERKLYFEDLPDRLKALLLTQLRQPGDISAVIETPGGFQIYLARERNNSQLVAAVFTLRKLGYEEWLAEQPDP